MLYSTNNSSNTFQALNSMIVLFCLRLTECFDDDPSVDQTPRECFSVSMFLSKTLSQVLSFSFAVSTSLIGDFTSLSSVVVLTYLELSLYALISLYSLLSFIQRFSVLSRHCARCFKLIINVQVTQPRFHYLHS